MSPEASHVEAKSEPTHCQNDGMVTLFFLIMPLQSRDVLNYANRIFATLHSTRLLRRAVVLTCTLFTSLKFRLVYYYYYYTYLYILPIEYVCCNRAPWINKRISCHITTYFPTHNNRVSERIENNHSWNQNHVNNNMIYRNPTSRPR